MKLWPTALLLFGTEHCRGVPLTHERARQQELARTGQGEGQEMEETVAGCCGRPKYKIIDFSPPVEVDPDKCRCFGKWEPSAEYVQCMHAAPPFPQAHFVTGWQAGCWCNQGSCYDHCTLRNTAEIRIPHETRKAGKDEREWYKSEEVTTSWLKTTVAELLKPRYGVGQETWKKCIMSCKQRMVCNSTITQGPPPDFVPIPADNGAPLDGYVPEVCAQEGEWCKCHGKATFGKKFVAGQPGEGAELTFAQTLAAAAAQKDMQGKELIKCASDDDGFGTDPAIGFNKQCWCENPLPAGAPLPSPGGQLCETKSSSFYNEDGGFKSKCEECPHGSFLISDRGENGKAEACHVPDGWKLAGSIKSSMCFCHGEVDIEGSRVSCTEFNDNNLGTGDSHDGVEFSYTQCPVAQPFSLASGTVCTESRLVEDGCTEKTDPATCAASTGCSNARGFCGVYDYPDFAKRKPFHACTKCSSIPVKDVDGAELVHTTCRTSALCGLKFIDPANTTADSTCSQCDQLAAESACTEHRGCMIEGSSCVKDPAYVLWV